MLKNYSEVNLETGEVIKQEDKLQELANDYKSQLTIVETDGKLVAKTIQENQLLTRFIKEALIEGEDWMKVFGIPKPVILQPAIDKLSRAFSLTTKYELLIRTLDHEIKLVDFEYRAHLYCRIDGREVFITSADASCNSLEFNQHSKFESYNKTTGTWSFKPNKSVWDVKNDISQMAQKRAEMRAVRKALGISGMFTQSVEGAAPITYTDEESKSKQKHVYQIAKDNNFSNLKLRELCERNKLPTNYKQWDVDTSDKLVKIINDEAERLKYTQIGR